MMFRKGHWIVLAAAAIAAAVLFVGLSVQEGYRRDLRALLARWGADVLFASARDTPEPETLEALEQTAAIEEIAVEGSTSLQIRPEQEYHITWLEVSPNYLEVAQPPLHSGRYFDGTDRRVAVLGWEVARVVFGDTDPIGQTLRSAEVIGVLAEIPAEDSARERFNRLVFKPLPAKAGSKWGRYDFGLLYIRTNGDQAAAEREILQLMPSAGVYPMSARQESAFSEARSLSSMLLLCGLATAIVATLLVGGMLTLSALRQQRAMGVRIAVGATRAAVFVLVAGGGAALTLCGALVGMGVGALATLAAEGRIHLALGHAVLPAAALLLGATAALAPAVAAARRKPTDLLAKRGLFGGRGSAGPIGAFVILAFAVASAAVVLVVNLSVSSITYISTRWGNIDERTLLVCAPAESILAGPDLTLTDKDLLEPLQQLELVVPYAYGAFREGSDYNTTMAPTANFVHLNLLQIIDGRDLGPEDFEPGATNCLISDLFAEQRGLGIGDTLIARGVARFEIVGVFGWERHNLKASVVLPHGFRNLLGPYYYKFIVRAEECTDLAALRGEIRTAFAEEHPGKAEVDVIQLNAQAAELGRFFRGANIRFGLTAALLLLLAVFEANAHGRFVLAQRMRSLGIRRSLGSSPARLLVLASRDTVWIAILGVAVGAAGVHVYLPRVLRWFPYLEQPSPLATLASAALAALLIAGLGILPIRNALSTTPSEMLRKGKT